MLVEKRTLGQSGIHASCLGLGTVKFGRNQEVKYPKTFSIPSDKQLEGLLDEARELGINLLDTAPAYGSSEQRIGQILTDRSNWILCTKVGEEFIDGKSFYNFSGQHTKTSIERSLKNLNTDYLDLVLVHSDGNDNTIINSVLPSPAQKINSSASMTIFLFPIITSNLCLEAFFSEEKLYLQFSSENILAGLLDTSFLNKLSVSNTKSGN